MDGRFEEIQGRLQWRTDECCEVKEVQEVQEQIDPDLVLLRRSSVKNHRPH
jgi:hypothetical protein